MQKDVNCNQIIVNVFKFERKPKIKKTFCWMNMRALLRYPGKRIHKTIHDIDHSKCYKFSIHCFYKKKI